MNRSNDDAIEQTQYIWLCINDSFYQNFLTVIYYKRIFRVAYHQILLYQLITRSA